MKMNVKIVRVNKGEEKDKAVEIASFYNEQRSLGNRVSRAYISAVGEALNITMYVDESGNYPSLVKKDCTIIRVEKGNEDAGAVAIAEFYNTPELQGSRFSTAISIAVGNDMAYIIFADTDPQIGEDDADDELDADITSDDLTDEGNEDETGDVPTGSYADDDDEPDYFS